MEDVKIIEENKTEQIENIINETEQKFKKKKKKPLEIETATIIPTEPEPKTEPKSKPKKESTKKRTTKKKKDDFREEVALMLAGINEVARILPNGDILALHEKEIEFIAPPIANILERQGLDEKASKYSDYTVLLVGLVFITMPRIQLIKERREKNVRPRQQPRNENRPPKDGDRIISSDNAPRDTDIKQAIYDPLNWFKRRRCRPDYFYREGIN